MKFWRKAKNTYSLYVFFFFSSRFFGMSSKSFAVLLVGLGFLLFPGILSQEVGANATGTGAISEQAIEAINNDTLSVTKNNSRYMMLLCCFRAMCSARSCIFLQSS